ncbi:MAG: M56 family metallopeptidase [Pedobacter sp.]|nr:M56 family metallopeptidase [Pedobacter sp.]
MEFSLLHISNELTRAICVALVYSLGLGLLLAALAGLVVMSTRRSKPMLRYNLLVAALFLFCLGTIFTFIDQLAAESHVLANQALASAPERSPIRFLKGELNESQVFGLLKDYSQEIVLIWLVMVLFKTYQLLSGLRKLRQLRKTAVWMADGFQERLKELAATMGIKRVIQFAESVAVKAPMVIGHFKPLILIPTGLLLALPPAAIEAILIHELAHIGRRDYLINLMVSAVETIFFFNPAVLWLGVLIREEREHCCDDVVLEHTSSRTAYIKALVVCQEYHFERTAFAMPLNGQRNHLLARVKRMLSQDNKLLNFTEKSLIGLGLGIAVIAILIFGSPDMPHIAAKNITDSASQTTSVMLDRKVEKVIGQELAKTDSMYLLQADKKHLKKDQTVSANATVRLAQDTQVDEQITQDQVHRQLIKLDGVLEHMDSKNKLKGKNYYLMLPDTLKSLRPKLPKLGALKTRYDYQQDYTQGPGKNYIESADRKTGYSVQLPIEAPVANQLPISLKTSGKLDISLQLAEAMLRDSLVSMVKSYKFSESELIVNGKSISPELFRSFKNKNINSIQKGSTIYYNYETHTVIN